MEPIACSSKKLLFWASPFWTRGEISRMVRGGIVLPMIMISPYVKRGFTDHHDASITSMATFAEHIFGLKPLGERDRRAYDFMGSFDFRQSPAAPVVMVQSPIPPRELRYILRHPEPDDDPT